MLVYDQNALLVGGASRVLEQQLEAARVDLVWVPPGLGEEPLQGLGLLALGAGQGLGVGQGG
jgi:hypothetical protein